MRMCFTIYAINAAAVCLALTCGIMFWGEQAHSFETFVSYLVEYMFIIFGPVLFMMSLVGLTQFTVYD